VQDFHSVAFAAEILNSVLSNTDYRKKDQKTSNAEIEELTNKLFFQQSCRGVIPKEEVEYLSYFALMAEDQVSFNNISELLVGAAESLIPVQLDPGNGFVPYVYYFLMDPVHKYSYSTGWKNIPGYGKSEDLFPLKDGFKPWFGIFSDTIGVSLLFYYPKNPSGVIEVPYHGVDLGDFRVYWRHGIPGLSKIMQIIYFEWLLRNYSYGLTVDT
tara:strand:+ start:31297 stop:31935 length:639 start_codon:yes stop_codon:yes gene_type:complete